MSDKWLVNDQISALGERTFWTDLLSLGLADKTGGYTPFEKLADKIELESAADMPRIIVRNGTYFRPIKVPCRQIAFVQDIASGRLAEMQQEVCRQADVVVCNSKYTKQLTKPATQHAEVIPIGVDFELFKPMPQEQRLAMREKHGVKNDTVLFVGAASKVKGWDFLCELIRETPFDFAIVTKDGARFEHPRVRNFGVVSQETLVEIMNACSALVCTSETETQHLAGIEAAACELPIVAPDIGVYRDTNDMRWGGLARERTVKEYKEHIFRALSCVYEPRAHFQELGCDKATCMKRWQNLLS